MAEASSSLPLPVKPVVKLTKVHYKFPKNNDPTLVDIDLEVMPGEIVILSGPSGCGKTTLLTLMGGLRQLQEGEIKVWDNETATYRPHDLRESKIEVWDSKIKEPLSLRDLKEAELVEVRKSIGFIFQKHNLLESLTATENVRMARNLCEHTVESDDDIRDMLKFLMLKEKAVVNEKLQTDKECEAEAISLLERKPANLSGGQCQRVAVARALINRPRLVLADEPTAALDKAAGESVVSLLQHLARDREPPARFGEVKRALLAKLTKGHKDCTSIIVTHDSRIMNHADRIVEMDQGRIRFNIVVAERKYIYHSLRKCPPFAPLLPETIYDLAESVSIKLDPNSPLSADHITQAGNKVEFFENGMEILHQGDKVNETSRFYLIRDGQVEIVGQKDKEGKPLHLGKRDGFGDCFGDRALVKREPRNATVKAVGRVVAYSFSFGELWKSLEKEIKDVNAFISRCEAVYGVSPRQA